MTELSQLLPCRRRDINVPHAAVRRAMRHGDLVAVRRGVLVGAGVFDRATTAVDRHVLATRIAVLATPGPPTFAALGSAAVIHGFQRLGRTPQRVRLCRSRGARWRDADVAVLVCGLPASHVGEFDGIPATTPARTAVDLARWVGFRSGVVVADSALRSGVTRQQLECVARDCRRWPGVRRARDVIEFADERAASVLESVSRVVFHEAGLPAPEPQKTLLWDEFGEPKYIVDFYWGEFRVAGEADGLIKYDVDMGDDGTGSRLRAEKLRQEDLEDAGYDVVRWGWDDIWRRPEWVVARVRRAFDRQQRRRAVLL